MKILLYEKNNADRELYHKSLTKWGFSVQVVDEETSVISILKQSQEIQLLIIGEFELDISRLITRIRGLRQYVYVLLLFSTSKNQSEIRVLKENCDDCISKPIDLPLLRYRIHMIKQVISFTFNVSINSKKPIPTKNRQVLNLDYVLKHVNSDRSQLKELFQRLVKDVGQRNVDVNTINDPVWERLLQKAEAVGAEQLSDWLVGLLFLKFNSEHMTLVNFGLLQHQYRQIQERLSEAILCLSDFGFFSRRAENEKVNPLDNKRVLLVEDMKYNRVLLKKILEKHNCSIVEAVNGEDAVECWKKDKEFDLIIMDMNMPVMDGFVATKVIRDIEGKQNLSRTPIIALTALAMRGDRELCIEAGTDDYLPKPVEANSLIKVCERLLVDEKTKSEDFTGDLPSLKIKRILMKTDNQIYFYSLEAIFKRLGLEFEHCDSNSEILEKVTEEEFDILILNADYDLELAYFIKNNISQQFIILITAEKHENNLLRLKANNNLCYPFDLNQVCAVLKLYSDKLKLVKKHAEHMADVDSLSKLKGQAGIEEAILNSNQQLAVWQKAFRKIGGDLVLSHQFNLHGRFGLILGDVAGHDIQSGYTASWFSGLVKGVWGQNSNPFDLLIYLNNLFAHNVEEENKRFVCSLALLWDSLRSKLYYANAGIPGGILINKDTGKAKMIEWTGVPIGMFPDMEMFD
ncbi:response regulator, partial [bacterium]|nr:response regulator [bacterium]